MIHLELPLEKHAELEALLVAEDLMAKSSMDEAEQVAVQMALIETIINAVEHSEARNGMLDVYFTLTPKVLKIVVSDQGRGFAAEETKTLDPQAKRAKKETRGWGLQIVRAMMDQVDWTSDETGTSVTMIKHLAHEII